MESERGDLSAIQGILLAALCGVAIWVLAIEAWILL